MSYIDTLKKRRSVYNLNNNITISEDTLINNVEQILLESPTAFHMQSPYLLILMNEEHKKLWNITTNTLKKIVPADKFKSTQDKMDMFSKAKGTILFFDNTDIIEQLKVDYPLYKDSFDTHAAHGMGILQANVWNYLAEENIGANLQHYNPLIDDEVKKEWNIPTSYQLTAQLVFGGIEEIPEPKEKIPGSLRMNIFK